MVPVSTVAKTISKIVQDKQIPTIKGTERDTRQLEIRILRGNAVDMLNVDPIYQRMINPSRIKKYGILNPQWLTAAILAERPDGSLWIIDGQNKAVLYSRSQVKDIDFHCLVFVHDKDSSVEECRKIEAKIYKNINENLKSLSTLQKIRSGVVFGDPESCWVERVMVKLNLTSQGFGSQKKDALEVLGFNQLHIMATKEFPCGTNELISSERISKMKSGLEIYKKMWAKDPTFTNSTSKKKPSIFANILRGCVLVGEFNENVLKNGQSVNFDNYLKWENFQFTNTKLVSKMIGGDGVSAKRFLHSGVLDPYNIYNTNHGFTGAGLIGEETLKKSLVKYGQKFSNPQVRV